MAARRVCWALSLVLAALWLTACSDGMTLKVFTDSLSFDNADGSLPESQGLSARVYPLEHRVYVGVLCTNNGMESCSYSLADNPFAISVTPKAPSTLSPGVYKDQIVIFACEDEACKKHLTGSPKVVPVSYTVRTLFSLQPAQVSITAVLGSNVAPGETSVNISGQSMFNWEASTNQRWIHLPRRQGQSRFDPLPVVAEVTGLAVGSYSGGITLTNPATGEAHELPVSLEMRPATVSAAPQALIFGGAEGNDFSSQPLAVSFDTGSNTYAWTATVDTGSGPRWLQLSKTSGTASSTPANLSASVDVSGLRGGIYSASITFTATVAGQTVSKTVPVSLRVTEHTLWASENGVSLVHTPSVSKLTHTVTLKDSWGRSTTPWTARSNQPWLTVTPGGTGNEPLTLTASPDGLASDTVHYATVTLGSSDVTVTRDETIQVGLWVGSQASNSQDKVYTYQEELEVDPIRPYVYVHDSYGTVSVYNLHTAARVTHLLSLGPGRAKLAISTDGSTLYVLDLMSRRVVPVDLRTYEAGAPWYLWNQDYPSTLHYARPSGHGLLLINGNPTFDASTGAALPVVTDGYIHGLEFGAASKDGSLFCGQSSFTGKTTTCWSLRYSSLEGGSVTQRRRGALDLNSSTSSDLVISPDGGRVYASLSDSLEPAVFDGKTLERLPVPPWGGSGSGTSLAMGPEGRLYEVKNIYFDSEPTSHDLWIADSAGSRVGSFRMGGSSLNSIEPRRLRTSGDGQRLVALTHDEDMVFATVP